MKWMWLAVMLGVASAANAEWESTFRKVDASFSGGAEFVEREARNGDAAARIWSVFFTTKQAQVAVIDNEAQASLAEAVRGASALAGTNGGYFHADWKPVGLMIAQGRAVNGFEKAQLLSGIFVVTKGVPRIVRSGAYKASAGDSDALQAGPFLVENGATITGLNATRAARRTVIATDGKGRWALMILSHVTLAEAGEILASRAVFPDFAIAQALNLDGGSSTALWVAGEPKPFYVPEFARVRNFVAVLPR